MQTTHHGRRVLVLVLAAGLALELGPTAVSGSETSVSSPDPQATGSVDTAGIPLVSTFGEARPSTEAEAQALSDALVFAENHPDDVGYPWIDPAVGSVVLSAVSPLGTKLINEERLSLSSPSSTRQVGYSFGQLEAIKDEVTTLRATGVPDAALIYMTGPDPKTNRIVIVVSAPSEQLFKALADRFGTEALELRIDASMLGAQPAADRQHDSSPFTGGASVQTAACSDGIPWSNGGSPNSMLTAAHCFSSGGSVKIGDYSNVGTVWANQEENWDPTYGTQYYSGQSVYRGDVALIRLSGAYTSGPRIYRGGLNSTTWSWVVSWYSRVAQFGDVVYLSGRASGETGPYYVDLTGWDFWYGGQEWARNMSSALATSSPCSAPGDSGGAIFSLDGGGLKAAGVMSGHGPGPCRIYFTPIYDSYRSLSGSPLLH